MQKILLVNLLHAYFDKEYELHYLKIWYTFRQREWLPCIDRILMRYLSQLYIKVMKVTLGPSGIFKLLWSFS
jgi:hypothetical protein